MAFVGFNTSYGGKWFGGYARGKNSKGQPINYTARGKRNILKQLPKLKGVKFTSGPYWKMAIPPNSLIYCDPPYEGTTKYKDGLNHADFWQWCRDKVRDGHTVFVSEYSAPEDFECVWEREVAIYFAKDTGSKRAVEKLFRCRARGGRKKKNNAENGAGESKRMEKKVKESVDSGSQMSYN